MRRAILAVGYKLSDLVRVQEKTEEVTKFNRDTGEPYQFVRALGFFLPDGRKVSELGKLLDKKFLVPYSYSPDLRGDFVFYQEMQSAYSFAEPEVCQQTIQAETDTFYEMVLKACHELGLPLPKIAPKLFLFHDDTE